MAQPPAPVAPQWQLQLNAPLAAGIAPNLAGPHLNPHLPPWTRPAPTIAARGNTANTRSRRNQWDAQTTRIQFANGIPRLVPLQSRITSQTTDQRNVNRFLATLQVGVTARVQAPPVPRPAGVPVRPAADSLLIFEREVSSRDANNRVREFGSVNIPAQGQTIHPNGGGAPPHPNRMTLRDYSAFETEAANAARPNGGTLYLVASRDNIANPLQTALGRMLAAQGAQAGTLVYQGGTWHNTGLLIISLAAIGPPGNRVYPGLQRVFIYDPSYPSEGAHEPATHPTTGTLAGGAPTVRLRDLLFQARTIGMLRRWAQTQGRRWAGRAQEGNIFIGGGGNVGPINACRDMVANWMDSVSTVVDDLDEAHWRVRHASTPQHRRLLAARQQEFDDFFADFDPVPQYYSHPPRGYYPPQYPQPAYHTYTAPAAPAPAPPAVAPPANYHVYHPAGTEPTTVLGAPHANIWLGRSKRQVEEDNMKIAKKEGAYDKRKMAPADAKDDQYFRVVELDGKTSLREYRFIKTLKGDWKPDPRFEDAYYFVREEEKKKDKK